MKKLVLLPLFLLFFTAIAHAHGPVRQKLERDIEIKAPAAKVWNIIKNYDDMAWLPLVQSVKGTGSNTVGATRVLTLKSGGTINEELKKYSDADMSYSYRITDMSTGSTISHLGQTEKIPVVPVTDYAASISVESKGDKAIVKWKAGFYRAYMNNLTKDGEPKAMNEAVAIAAVESIFKSGLEKIKALAEK